MAKYRQATGKNILRAFNKAARRIAVDDPDCVSCSAQEALRQSKFSKVVKTTKPREITPASLERIRLAEAKRERKAAVKRGFALAITPVNESSGVSIVHLNSSLTPAGVAIK